VPNTLSQDEIDALLATGSKEEAAAAQSAEGQEVAPGTETESKSAKNYDFQHPDKFSKLHLSAIHRINEELARQLGAALYIYLRQNTRFSLTQVRQITYGEFMADSLNPATLVVFSLPPLQGSAILCMDSNLTFMVFDRLLGGNGDLMKADRELTDIEKGIVKKLSSKILDIFGEAWAEVIKVKPRVDRVETHPELVQIVPPNEATALITFEVEMRNKGQMSICLPYLTLEPATSKLGRQIWFSAGSEGKELDVAERKLLERNLKDVALPVTIELGKTTIAIRDLLQLQIQDAIQVDTPREGNASVRIQGKTKFYGKPGTVGKKLAVKINSLNREGDEA
jgi:flagellar motor switch protein FliM